MSKPQIEPTTLSLLTEDEKAAVLDDLVLSDRNLGGRAEHAARQLLAKANIDEVANVVAETVLALDHEELATCAGRTRHSYVQPTEAAWSLLEQTIEPWLEDVVRRVRIGLDEPAPRLVLGILQGLHRISDQAPDDDSLISWAPDFPSEAADSVLRVLADVGIELTGAELASVGIARG